MSLPEPWERYYDQVVTYLKMKGLWEKVTRKFPPNALRSAVKRIYERFGSQEAADHFDWGPIFASILDYDTTDDFIKDLEFRGLIPPAPLKVSEDVRELLRELGLPELPEPTDPLFETKLDDILRELATRLKEAQFWKGKVQLKVKGKTVIWGAKKIYEEFSKLQDQIRELKRKLEEAKRPIAPPFRYVTVKVKEHIPSFTGVDGKVYGPFEAGQLATIPEPDAAKLVEEGKAALWMEIAVGEVEKGQRGLGDAEKKMLETKFFAELARRGITVASAKKRGYYDMFLDEFEKWKSDLADTPTDKALKVATTQLMHLIDEIEAIHFGKRPFEVPEVKPKVMPFREEVPVGVPPERPPERPAEVRPIPPERAEPPPAPLEPMSFPRRLASSEIKAFWKAFRYKLWELGLDAYDYLEYWRRFRDAWHKDWHHVLNAFHSMIEDIKEGKPPRYYPRPFIAPEKEAKGAYPWKEIPKDPILHVLATKVARSMDELLAILENNGIRTNAAEVTLIVKEEWKKGDQMSSWLKIVPREYLRQILGQDPEDP